MEVVYDSIPFRLSLSFSLSFLSMRKQSANDPLSLFLSLSVTHSFSLSLGEQKDRDSVSFWSLSDSDGKEAFKKERKLYPHSHTHPRRELIQGRIYGGRVPFRWKENRFSGETEKSCGFSPFFLSTSFLGVSNAAKKKEVLLLFKLYEEEEDFFPRRAFLQHTTNDVNYRVRRRPRNFLPHSLTLKDFVSVFVCLLRLFSDKKDEKE